MDVDYDKPAVYQLWNEAQVIITIVNSVILKLLKLVAIDEGHGIPPF